MSRSLSWSRRGGVVAVGAAMLAGCALPGSHTLKPPGSPAAARINGTLRIGITAPSGLDPIGAADPSAQLVDSLLCDTLVSIDPRSGFPVPGLLGTWTSSGKTLTLQLHHGIHMSDGRTLTADDVANSLNRLANPGFASPASKLLTEVAGFQGLNDNLFAKATDGMGGISVVDQYDLQVTLTQNDAGFLYTLASPFTAPVSAKVARSDPQSLTSDPVCVGPYRLHAPYRTGAKQIVLDRTPNYVGHNLAFTGGGMGYAAHVVFDIYPSQDAAYTAFRKGAVDLVELPPSARGRAAPAGATVVTSPTTTEEYLGFPGGSESEPAAAAFRIALSRSLDRTAIIDKTWGAGGALPATGFLPTGFGLSSLGTSCGSSVPASGEVAGARASLSPAELAGIRKGFGQTSAGPALAITVNNDYRNVAEAGEIASQLDKAFGVNVKVTSETWDKYMQQATVGAGFSSLFRVSWQAGAVAPTPTNLDPVSFLDAMFSTNGETEGNWAHYTDLRFDTTSSVLAQPAALGLDRLKAVKDLATYLCQQMPVIPLAVETSQWLVRSSTWASAKTSYLSADGDPLIREFYLR